MERITLACERLSPPLLLELLEITEKVLEEFEKKLKKAGERIENLELGKRYIVGHHAPQAIVSLWKIDHEATRALMEKFYELWNPKEGEGARTATALRKAQEFVREQEKWEHPFYWAGWQVWGTPE